MIRSTLSAAVLLAGMSAIVTGCAPPSSAISNVAGPRYDGAGRLIVPADYREWVFVSSGIDMNYNKLSGQPTAHVFGNVFAPREAYRRFVATGHWPDKTILILENRLGTTKGSINRAGQFQTGNVAALEAHVRDEARFKGGWGFFIFDGGKPAERVDYRADCYSCHKANAAVDTTFVQFYPTLLPIAIARNSVMAAQRKEAIAIAGN